MKRKETVVFGWLPSPIGGMGCLLQEFVDSVFKFITQDSEGRHIFQGYTFAKTGYIASGRCDVVQSFLDKTKADWLLMLDWDITFEPYDVYALLDEAKGDPMKVVSGCYLTYFGGDNLLRPCWMHHEDGEDYVPVTEFEIGKVIPITVCGMGFTLMHRTLLEKMREEYKSDPWPWFGHDEINGSRVGEDITFTSRARKLGATIWGHGGVQLGHTKSKTLRTADMGDTQYARSEKPNVNKSVLNVGGAPGTLPPNYNGWKQVSLDIDPEVRPDIVADARYMSKVKDKFDAVYCSHNIEHYEEEDVPKVLRNINRVLNPNGSVVIRTPDLTVVKNHLKKGGKESDLAYQSPAGPITYGDMLTGHKAQIEDNEFMKHKTMFTKSKLRKALADAGFRDVKVNTGNFELMAVGVK